MIIITLVVYFSFKELKDVFIHDLEYTCIHPFFVWTAWNENVFLDLVNNNNLMLFQTKDSLFD